jgi:RNA polymerase sigma factor (sigma-70 family)
MSQVTADDVRRAAQGDEAAWAALVEQYGGLLRAISMSFRLGRDEGADAAQTTWLRLVEHIGTLREPERVAGWLSVTMRRECIRLVSRKRREQLTDDFAWTEPRSDGTTVDADVLLAERNARLWQAVDRLPARQRQLLRALNVSPQPSYHDVSSALSMAVGSIGPTRAKALRRLRELLAESGVTEEELALAS